MTSQSQALVQKLWRFCNVLRDDGLSYPDYVEQLTFLLFLKMANERSIIGGGSIIPDDCDWDSIVSKRGAELHAHYSMVINRLGEMPGILGVIFGGARNRIKDPRKLQKLVVELVGKESWTSLDVDVKGDAYEGLLDKTAQDYKSGAGQYFTARPLIDAIVEVMKPQLGETICDPACGTGGFLLSAARYIRKDCAPLAKRKEDILRYRSLFGTELVDSVARLAAMNLLLHDIGPASDEADPPITVADSLQSIPTSKFDIVLTNPPFGKKSSVRFEWQNGTDDPQRRRPDFLVDSANKQVNFLQHVLALMKDGSRAAVVLPDNVLFERGAAEVVRRHLLDSCERLVLLRLPTGIFYAQGVKANVLFFSKGVSARAHAERKIWTYDLRSHKSFSLKTNPLGANDLQEFVELATSIGRNSEKKARQRWKSFDIRLLQESEGARMDFAWPVKVSGPHLKRESALDLGLAIEANLKEALSEIRATVRQLNRDAGDKK
jgi:type I restriction enzyme M protein